ncbi:MAG: type II toxin-antitoxin system RelE/ParE family toxin [Candidatus Binatia bacterium]
MEASEKEVQTYLRPDGTCPFNDWLESLRDRQARARIRARINRVRLGNLGDCKSVGSGVSELRIDYGPGYRVYFGIAETKLVILLCGGDKRSQRGDIREAIACWEDYKK